MKGGSLVLAGLWLAFAAGNAFASGSDVEIVIVQRHDSHPAYVHDRHRSAAPLHQRHAFKHGYRQGYRDGFVDGRRFRDRDGRSAYAHPRGLERRREARAFFGR